MRSECYSSCPVCVCVSACPGCSSVTNPTTGDLSIVLVPDLITPLLQSNQSTIFELLFWRVSCCSYILSVLRVPRANNNVHKITFFPSWIIPHFPRVKESAFSSTSLNRGNYFIAHAHDSHIIDPQFNLTWCSLTAML